MTVRLGPGFVIFLLFFALALFESVQAQNWAMAAFWFLMGLLFFIADNMRLLRGVGK